MVVTSPQSKKSSGDKSGSKKGKLSVDWSCNIGEVGYDKVRLSYFCSINVFRFVMNRNLIAFDFHSIHASLARY